MSPVQFNFLLWKQYTLVTRACDRPIHHSPGAQGTRIPDTRSMLIRAAQGATTPARRRNAYILKKKSSALLPAGDVCFIKVSPPYGLATSK